MLKGDRLSTMSQKHILRHYYPSSHSSILWGGTNENVTSVLLQVRKPSEVCKCASNAAHWPWSCSLQRCWRHYKNGLRRAVYFLRDLPKLQHLSINIRIPSDHAQRLRSRVRDEILGIFDAFADIGGMQQVHFMINGSCMILATKRHLTQRS